MAQSSRRRTVAILGASRDRAKYGNMSLRAHRQKGWDVYPVNPNAASVEGLPAFPTLDAVPVELDRISVYLPPAVGIRLLDEIARKGAAEVFFNPGSATPELVERARSLGLNAVEACSIVDLGLSPEL